MSVNKALANTLIQKKKKKKKQKKRKKNQGAFESLAAKKSRGYKFFIDVM